MPPSTPIPIVAIGPYRLQTGFTRILWNILTRLGAGYDIHYVGIGYKGARFRADGVTVHPCNLQGGDVFGAHQGAALARAIGARALICLNDLWMLKNYVPAFAALRASPEGVPDAALPPKILLYAPLDGRLPDDQLLTPFPSVDAIVSYTAFARDELQRTIASIEARTPIRFASRGVRAIPHGVDTQAFHPIARTLDRQLAPGGRRAAREQLFPDRPDLHDAFLVLNANRPMPRKRLELTIEGFALFARDLPATVKLVLHHAIMTADERAQTRSWAAANGIADRLIVSSSLDGDQSGTTAAGELFTDARLNLLYNACEVGVNSAMGEAWGHASCEHAATGAAQIVPRHSACEELWRGAALLIDPVERLVPPFALLEMASIAPAALAAALRTLYHQPDYLREMSQLAYARATQPAWQWSAIAAQWDALLRELLEIPPASPQD